MAARKPENTFRASIHRLLPVDLHHEHFNNPYGSGTADDWYSGDKADLWVEYKFLARKPQRAVVRPSDPKAGLLSQLQLNWLNGRHDQGRNVAVIIGCPDGGVVLRNREWEGEFTSEQYAERMLTRKELAAWIVGQTMRESACSTTSVRRRKLPTSCTS